MKRWLQQLRYNLARRFFADVIAEEFTEVLHPEFGSYWAEGGEGDIFIKQATFDGWCQCLDSVRASLRDYPNAGGDIEIMNEVDRIVADAVGMDREAR